MSDIPDDIIKTAQSVASGWGLDGFSEEVHAKEIAATILEERDRVLVACNAYLKEQYGIHPLENPIDRARIDALLTEAGTR